MPGVVVLSPTPSLAGFGPDTHSTNRTHLPRQLNDPTLNSSTMHNGLSSLGSVQEIKEHAKITAERSKGFSAKALLGSARSQMHQAQLKDAARDPKAALHALYVAANLMTTYTEHSSYAADRTKGNPNYNEFRQFFQEYSDSLNRIKSLEAELDLERSTTTVSPHQGELSNMKSLADRMKMLGQNGLVDPTTKRYSREVAPGTPPPLYLPDPVRSNRTSPSLSSTVVLSTSSSASNSTAPSPYAFVPPSSLGPPSPTSTESSETGFDRVASGVAAANEVEKPSAIKDLGGISTFEPTSHPWNPTTNDVLSGIPSSPERRFPELLMDSSGSTFESALRPWKPSINDALSGIPSSPERRFPKLPNDSPGLLLKSHDSDTLSDTPASISRANILTHIPSSISYSYSRPDSTPRTPPVIPHSLANGSAAAFTPIQYPSFSTTSHSSASRSGATSLISHPPAIPPQASINHSPLVRRRSDYVEQGTGSASFSARLPIDYPDLPHSHIIRPPPPVASSSFQRHHSHSQSYSVSTLKEPPKPPTIPSNYPVTYWSDMQIVTVGLKNLGNTCYMNATIQCLSATVPFARFFTEGRWRKAVNAVNPMGTKGNLASAFATILYEMSHSELPHLIPASFRKSICTHAPQFSGSDQHDSQEFLTFLLDGLHEDLNRVLHKPSNGTTPEREAELERLPQSIASAQEWEIYRMRNDSLIVDFFQGQFKNRLVCLTCRKTSTTYNSFMYLSLPMPSVKGLSKTSLQSCLDAFVKEEVLSGTEAWHCPHCKTLRNATKQLSLSRLPPILLIHLKRFSHKGVFTDKIETVVDFPLKGLDLTNYMPPALPPGMHNGSANGIGDPRVQTPPYKYDLYGVTNHFGNLSNGHYTAFIASRGGWVYCDDSRVMPTDAKDIVGRPAYVLYYKRIES
ncbi:cysteine proteinase [Suillus hirtellus]|nr:cysteine proteinase [Suillus hirtellus]